MWINKQMEEDIENKITWNPSIGSWKQTLDDIADALAVAGYNIEIHKVRD